MTLMRTQLRAALAQASTSSPRASRLAISHHHIPLSRRYASSSRPTPPPRPATQSAPPNNSSPSAPILPGMNLTSYMVLLASLAGAALAGYYTSEMMSSSTPLVQYTLIDSARAKELQAANQPVYGDHKAYLEAIQVLRDSWTKKGKSDQVSTDKEDLESHGISDWSYHEAKVPTVVVWVENTEEVVEVVKIATKYRIPITPFSGGTSLEGHFSSVSPTSSFY